MNFEIIILFTLLCASALFSGLTIGLMSLDLQTLKRKVDLADKQATIVYRVRKHANWMLTTLLLGNAAVNSALSIILADLMQGYIAGIIATILIFIFGEVLPQAIFSRNGLKFGAKTAWLVTALMYLTYPITRLLAYGLDLVLGAEQPSLFSRPELLSLIKEHHHPTFLDSDEVTIVSNSLTFSTKVVKDVMTPASMVQAFQVDQILTAEKIEEMKKSGISRFPVYGDNTHDLKGILYIRELVGLGPDITVVSVLNEDILIVDPNERLDAVLAKMLGKKMHLAMVVDEFKSFRGVISSEDIIEEILGTEIVDEYDKIPNMRDRARMIAQNI